MVYRDINDPSIKINIGFEQENPNNVDIKSAIDFLKQIIRKEKFEKHVIL
jgi:hypothetical protein